MAFLLDWHRQDGGHVILRDVDESSDRHNSYTKMNTLHHYNVTDGSTLELILRSVDELDDNPTCKASVVKSLFKYVLYVYFMNYLWIELIN